MDLRCQSFDRTAWAPSPEVVIVEDDPDCLALLEESLASRGLHPRSFDNGLDAWQAIQDDPGLPLVIANWILPGLDGYRICTWLAERESPPMTVLMVGRHFLPEVMSMPGLRATHLLAKPLREVDIEQIRAAFAAHLASHPARWRGPDPIVMQPDRPSDRRA
jgi:DNA-binding response OmpR family regulator